MTNRVRAICLGFGLILFTCPPRAAFAQDADVLAGYQRFYRGEKESATTDFERMVAANPGRLAARFGLLSAPENRSRGNHALELEFERQMDPFIADAEARYSRSATDDEALFYLGNAYLLRASYRFDHNKGVWGAARDG